MARPITVTTGQWVAKALTVHGDTYVYTNTNYSGANKPITVTCRIHGAFTLKASKHLEGVGCKECSIERQRNTLENFLSRAAKVHGNRYDYSLVEYKRLHDPVRIICREHGEFSQSAIKHLSGQGCKKCNRGEVWGIDEFKKKARLIHGEKYNYNAVTYEKTNKKIKIICNACKNEFDQSPNSHLSGSGCPYCGGSKKLSDNEFKELLLDAHDGEIVSIDPYENMDTKITVRHTCGNEWKTTPLRLIHRMQGCPSCALDARRMTHEQFIERLDEMHNAEITPLEDYVHSKQAIRVRHLVCGREWDTEPRIVMRYGCRDCAYDALKTTPIEFDRRLASVHRGEIIALESYKTVRDEILFQHSCGHRWRAMPGDIIRRGTSCPACATSKGNKRIGQFLKDANIEFETEVRFETCKNRVALPFDFYIPALETLIEYDGEQHFKAIDFWGGERGLEERKYRDQIKNSWAMNNKKILHRIKYDEDVEFRMRQILQIDPRESNG
jgi:hypothetical protein